MGKFFAAAAAVSFICVSSADSQGPDLTPEHYMTCDELMDVAPIATRDPGIPFICADVITICESEPRCAPGETTVIRAFGAEPPWRAPLGGCVETGTYACDDQAHVDCCAW